MEDPEAIRSDPAEPTSEEAPDRSRLAMGLASAWPPADLLGAVRAGAAEALALFAGGDVLGARRRWGEVGGMLARRPKGQRGVPRIVAHAGRSMKVSEWARELGWSAQALAYRLDTMPLDEALVSRKPKA